MERANKTSANENQMCIGDVFDYLAPGIDANLLPEWPPDVFAVAISILRRSGSYTHVVEDWPPGDAASWVRDVKKTGIDWREASVAKVEPPPRVVRLWNQVLAARNETLESLSGTKRESLCEALLELCAIADEACSGVGINRVGDAFQDLAEELLISDAAETRSATLCRRVDCSRLVVLPKLHTPKSGLTIHSLSHNLAMCDPGDVMPLWYWPPQRIGNAINLLLLPWPNEILPRQFQESPGHITNLPKDFGFFKYEPDTTTDARQVRATRAAETLAEAKRLVGDVHGIVFPELALEPNEATDLCGQLQVLVIGGEGRGAADKTTGINQAAVAVPLGSELVTSWRQGKHHRWKLDRRQITQYGLGSRLSPQVQWWEDIRLGQRKIQFWSANSWLTYCVLICEDLARQEPVAQFVRAVGPNLVIALLMDGPQLASRWAARYATVLADDPGCSVLALTSIGMAQLSRPSGKPPSRVVALWKEDGGDAVEIDCPVGADGVLICLTAEVATEYAADGRSDGGATGYVRLHGVHPVFRGGTRVVS